MKVLLIYAHPEPRSLNGALKNFAIRHLQQAGHEVQVSDLYAMRWKAGYDADDSGAPPVGEFWRPTLDSKQAFAQGTQSADIVAEQGKAAVGRYGDFPVPAMVVLDARHHEGLDRPGVRLGLCLWRRRAQRPPLGRSLRGRHFHRQAGDADRHRRRLGGTLFTARDQWPHRRHPVPHSARYAVLSRL